MEETLRADHIDAGLHGLYARDRRLGQVCSNAFCLHLLSITKELMTQVKKARLHIQTVHGSRGRSSVVYKLTKVLSKAAPCVKEGLAGFESCEDIRIAGVLRRGEVEEPQVSDAWVWPRSEGAFALSLIRVSEKGRHLIILLSEKYR